MLDRVEGLSEPFDLPQKDEVVVELIRLWRIDTTHADVSHLAELGELLLVTPPVPRLPSISGRLAALVQGRIRTAPGTRGTPKPEPGMVTVARPAPRADRGDCRSY